MRRQNQSVACTNWLAQFSALAPLVPLLIGGWLALAATQTTAQAQAVLPPVPDSGTVFDNQSPLPTPTQRQYDFQSPPPREFGPDFERYLVYVNGDSSLLLQQVQQIEPTAYVRRYKGRAVIQAGVFSEPLNAQRRVKELESLGIEGARIETFSGSEVLPSPNDEGISSAYFVAIPASRKDLSTVEQQVKRLTVGKGVEVQQRSEPRGTHVAVGPLTSRQEAEDWSRYLQRFGMKNARVYYRR